MSAYGYDSPTVSLARFLGWFSIGLGLAELLAPRHVGRPIGMEDREVLLRGYGLREIATGVGILASENPAPWVWGRVAGDALDLATVAVASDPERRDHLTPALASLALVSLLDIYCAARLTGAVEEPIPDYSGRSGFPASPETMRGAALPGGEFVP